MAVGVNATSNMPAGRGPEQPLDDRLKVAMHEIRQPVSVVLALAEAARGSAGVTPEVRDYLDRIIDQMQELAAAVTSVLVPSGPSDGSPPATVDVDEVVDSVVDAVRVTWSGSLERRGMRGVRWNTRGDRVALRRCVLDVVDNAVRAAGPDGTVTVSVHPSPEGGRIVVDDDGPGFGRGPHGVGIGLAITRQTLDAMAAGLTVGPGPAGNGCRVVLCLGAEPGEPSADSSRTG
jgi:signal transduction histidine kinase